MKNLSYFGIMLFCATMACSCASDDKAITEPYTTVVLDGYKYKTDLVATFKGQVGEEVTLGLGVYDPFDIYGVDFGDGIIVADTVCAENGGLKGEDGLTKPLTTHTSTTMFKGTIAGDGTVKVYGKSDIWYLTISGNLMPTAFDQPKLANVVQVNISGADAQEIALPVMASLTQLHLSNVPVKTLDVSNAPELTSLQVIHTGTSKYDVSPLASIDLSKNTKLTSLTLGNTAYKPGILTSLDLTQNTALENVVISNNMPVVKWFDVRNNKIKGDLVIPSEKLTNVYVNNNELTSVSVPNVTKQFYFDNNKMTLATLPALPEGMNTTSKKKQFHYQPQADMEVAPEGSVLDLSAQASAKGIEAEPQATVFTITAGNAALVEGKDYTVKDGKITFITDQTGAVVIRWPRRSPSAARRPISRPTISPSRLTRP